METNEAFEVIKKAIKDDPDYAWSWLCNIAVPFIEEGGSHKQANMAAAIFMKNVFDVDVTTTKGWKAFSWA